MLKRGYNIWFIVGGSILLVLPSLIYYLYFKDYSISNDTGDWGAFSDYLNPWFSLANLLAIIFLTLYVGKIEGDRELENRKFQIQIEQRTRLSQEKIEKENREFQKKIFFTEARRSALRSFIEMKESFWPIFMSYIKEDDSSIQSKLVLEIIRECKKFETLQLVHNDLFKKLKTEDLTNKLNGLTQKVYKNKFEVSHQNAPGLDQVKLVWETEDFFSDIFRALQKEIQDEWKEPNT